MEDILNKLEDESNKYKNVGSILSRLKQSGFLTQYYQLINEIFSYVFSSRVVNSSYYSRCNVL